MSRERSQSAFRSIVGKTIPEVILEARWANIVLGTTSVTSTLSEGLPLDSWEGYPRSDSGGRIGKAWAASKVSRTRSQSAFSSIVGKSIPEVILEARWAKIAMRAKNVTRTLSEGLPLDSWEGHPRSDSGGQMVKYCSGSKQCHENALRGPSAR